MNHFTYLDVDIVIVADFVFCGPSCLNQNKCRYACMLHFCVIIHLYFLWYGILCFSHRFCGF